MFQPWRGPIPFLRIQIFRHEPLTKSHVTFWVVSGEAGVAGSPEKTRNKRRVLEDDGDSDELIALLQIHQSCRADSGTTGTQLRLSSDAPDDETSVALHTIAFLRIARV
ncbi:hypothetical protein L1987_12033 [Smallanthus sonchifolius]|uniref:Uncharacterized protein n=1 Tax=Smallanthus sonchifolius TaxID=185202 RepID=A0ACB9JER3_9ASTR|nr:hypothetical protein L1987_12033 [Smallanthus sonchifolius]